ncbi:Di-sulfide bridge nucleocytoplasmic transport domain-containing protein, partial [Podospora australis]
IASFDSSARISKVSNDPFASAARRGSPLKPQDQPRPPHASFFQPQLQNKPTAPAFRNPAFTTPQKHYDDSIMSDYSPADSSPAMTDTSIMPAETPDQDRDGDPYGRYSRTPSPTKFLSPIKPSSPTKTLFGQTLLRNHAAGRGEIARSSRDKVRKRRRQLSDRDVGSVRPRLDQDSDGSDSEFEGGSKQVAIRSKGNEAAPPPSVGWFNSFLATITAHPTAPALLSRWISLGMSLVIFILAIVIILAIVQQVRSDLQHATNQARDNLRASIAICKDHWLSNNCFPKERRMPALEAACSEWETCMNQDPDGVMRTNISIAKVAEILNEFVNVLSLKAWAFLMSFFLVVLLTTLLVPGARGDTGPLHPPLPAAPIQSPPAGPPPMFGAAMNPSTAFIWAPINQTPRSVRKALFLNNDATDVDSSPDYKAIMPAPQTPSLRRSPSKGDRERDRNRSPSKSLRQRSPSKGY